MKLPGVISLRKLLPTWAMPNGGFLPAGLEHVGEVHEHALGRLRAEVHLGPGPFHRPGEGLEHQVEGPGLGEAFLGAAARADGRVLEVVLPEPAACTPCSRRAGR